MSDRNCAISSEGIAAGGRQRPFCICDAWVFRNFWKHVETSSADSYIFIVGRQYDKNVLNSTSLVETIADSAVSTVNVLSGIEERQSEYTAAYPGYIMLILEKRLSLILG